MWTVGQTGEKYIGSRRVDRAQISCFLAALVAVAVVDKIGNFSTMNNLHLQFLIFYLHLFKHCSYINDNLRSDSIEHQLSRCRQLVLF